MRELLKQRRAHVSELSIDWVLCELLENTNNHVSGLWNNTLQPCSARSWFVMFKRAVVAEWQSSYFALFCMKCRLSNEFKINWVWPSPRARSNISWSQHDFLTITPNCWTKPPPYHSSMATLRARRCGGGTAAKRHDNQTKATRSYWIFEEAQWRSFYR